MKRSCGVNKAAAKKAKIDPVHQKCNLVQSAIKGATHLPQDALEMLKGMLYGSLATPKDQRHPYQSEIVAMIGDALGGIEAETRATIATGEKAAGGFDQENAKRAAATEVSEANLSSIVVEVRSKKGLLAEACLAFRKTRAELQEAQEAQRAGDADLKAVSGKRTKLQAIVQEMFSKLKEGAEGAPEAAHVMGSLRKHVELDDSLMTATQSALSKPPDARGPFDAMAINQLEEQISKTIAEFDAKISDSEPATAARAAAVAKAQVAHDATKTKQKASAGIFTSAQEDETECETALTAARKAVKDLTAEARKAASGLMKATAQLDQFLEGPMATFADLRDRETPPPPLAEPEPVAVIAAAADDTKVDDEVVAIAAPADDTMGSVP